MIPTKAGRDTVCVCGHWWEEHNEPNGGDVASCEGCHAGRLGGVEHGFEFDPAGNTPDMIADRGGDPAAWPQWVKDHYGPERMAEWTA
jgi:hypothetical protein